jgi:hypothetical protein
MATLNSAPPPPDLWAHQHNEIEDHWFTRARALLWSMRTGKTRTIIKTADRLHRYGDLLGVLILAPNGVHGNWITRELPKWAPRDRVEMSWDSNASRQKTAAFLAARSRLLARRGLGDAIRWLAVNDEALINPRCQELIQEFRLLCHDRILMVADESTMFRRASADRTRIARGLAHKLWWKRILEGTALLNSPLHAFTQYELLQKGALGFENWTDFQARYAVYVQKREKFTNRSYKMLDHYQNLDELRERMARWSSVVMREDCHDMPPLLTYQVDVQMSDKQVRAYKKMAKEMMLDLESGDFVEALNGGAKMIKLHQIVGGFINNKQGDPETIDDNPPILDAMEREVTGHGGKTIVWCRFQEDIRRVVARLEKIGLGVVQYHGDVSRRDRDSAIDRFQNDPLVTVFVGQPQAGGRGLDLSAADLIVWYSLTPDAIVTEQANERATQMAGKAVNLAILTTANTVHDLIWANNQGKVVLADQVGGRGLRDLLRAQVAAL